MFIQFNDTPKVGVAIGRVLPKWWIQKVEFLHQLVNQTDI
jgi:hypothetical protein